MQRKLLREPRVVHHVHAVPDVLDVRPELHPDHRLQVQRGQIPSSRGQHYDVPRVPIWFYLKHRHPERPGVLLPRQLLHDPHLHRLHGVHRQHYVDRGICGHRHVQV